MKRRLIVMARRPLPGRAKTRLGAAIGNEQAAGVYARLLYTLLLDLTSARLPGVDLELSLAAPSDVPFFAAAFPEFVVRAQVEGDLGRRLAAVFAAAFVAGVEQAIVAASDVAGLDPSLIEVAFRALDGAPLVIGPSCDGGYYLLGQRAPGAALFEGLDWGTDRVLAQTAALATARHLSTVYLTERLDVDTGEDYARWRRTLSRRTGANDRLDPR